MTAFTPSFRSLLAGLALGAGALLAAVPAHAADTPPTPAAQPEIGRAHV